jgi:hypothetical protein
LQWQIFRSWYRGGAFVEIFEIGSELIEIGILILAGMFEWGKLRWMENGHFVRTEMGGLRMSSFIPRI